MAEIIDENGKEWPSTEHYYQAAKTTDPEMQEKIRLAVNPGLTKKMGKNLSVREDWDEFRVEVMRKALDMKFSQHADLRNQLIETGDAELVEGTYWHDVFWGICTCAKHNGEGENMLGKMLMELRDKLKTEKEQKLNEILEG